MAVYSSVSVSSIYQIASARHVRCQYDPSGQQQLGQSVAAGIFAQLLPSQLCEATLQL